MLSHKPVFFSYLASMVSIFAVTFYSPFLTLQFANHYKIKDSDMGYYYICLTGFYLISCLILPPRMKNVPRRLQFVMCFFLTTIGFALMGPTEWLMLPDELTLILVGMSLTGFVQSMSFIPVLPEAIDQTKLRFKIVEGVDKATDSKMHVTLASLNNLSSCVATLICPIVGGALYDSYGYKPTMNYGIAFIGVNFIFFAIFNCGFNIFSETEQEETKLSQFNEIRDKLIAKRENFN